MGAAIIGLIGVVIGAGVTTATTYLLALRKETTEERNWRRERVLEAYSQFLAAVDVAISATTIAYGTACGTEEHSRERKTAYDAVDKMYHCPPSALVRQIGRLRKGGFLAHRSLSRSEDETEIRTGERTGDASLEEHPPRDAAPFLG
jgi:hypothetical protein